MTPRLRSRCKVIDTLKGPAQCLRTLLRDSLTSTETPGHTDTPAEGLTAWALTFCPTDTLLRCLFSTTCLTSLDLCLRCSMNTSSSPLYSVPSTRGTKVSRVVLAFPAFRPKQISKGDILPGREVSGRVRLIQYTDATYSSQHRGQASHSVTQF